MYTVYNFKELSRYRDLAIPRWRFEIYSSLVKLGIISYTIGSGYYIPGYRSEHITLFTDPNLYYL